MGIVETTEFVSDIQKINHQNLLNNFYSGYFPTAYEISSAYLSPEMHCHLINSPEVIVTTKTDIW